MEQTKSNVNENCDTRGQILFSVEEDESYGQHEGWEIAEDYYESAFSEDFEEEDEIDNYFECLDVEMLDVANEVEVETIRNDCEEKYDDYEDANRHEVNEKEKEVVLSRETEKERKEIVLAQATEDLKEAIAVNYVLQKESRDLYDPYDSDEDGKLQSEPLEENQIENSSGGFVWKVDDTMLLKRFLILGNMGSMYYTSSVQMQFKSLDLIFEMIKKGKGVFIIETVKHHTDAGLSIKQDYVSQILAMCLISSCDETHHAVYKAVNDVCRIPTHLFQFLKMCEILGGKKKMSWGRANRTMISKWYNKFNPLDLARLVTKYKERHGWSHKDLLRLTHVKAKNREINVIFCYILNGLEETKKRYGLDGGTVKKIVEYFSGIEEAKKCTNEEEMARLIVQHDLMREHCSTQSLNSKLVWIALLQKMPTTAMIRNLGKMTKEGVFDEDQYLQIVVDRLHNVEILKAARIHPFVLLMVWKVYRQGHGDTGNLMWVPKLKILNAILKAFEGSFGYTLPTKKRFLLGVDVSPSMDGGRINGIKCLDCLEAAMAMMMITHKIEPDVEIIAFSKSTKNINITRNDDFDSLLQQGKDFPEWENTDCAKPMLWAKNEKKQFDVFVIYTDNETNSKTMHPTEALRRYREWSGIHDARLIVCSMAANEFTIADPDDPYMMDVVGFDTEAPEVMRSFILGEL